MNIFKRNKYAKDSGTMMFYALLVTLFLLPFSGDGAAYTLFLGWFFYLLKVYFSGWQWKRTHIDLPLAVFVCIAFLSVINSPQKMFSFYNAYHLIGKYLLIYYLAVQCIVTEEQIRKIIFSIGISAVLVLFYGFFQYTVGINTAGMDWTDMQAFPEMTMRVFSTWENPNILAGYLNMVMAIAFGIFIYTDEKKARLIIGVFFILAVIILGFTYARGACLSIVAVIAAYGIFCKKKIILPLVAVLAVLMYLDTALFDRMTSVFTTIDTSSELRLALWESTVEMVLDHPLLGIGWGAYYFVYPSYDFYMQGNFIKIVHAHNMYLNIAAETGIIGLLSFIVCLGGSIWRALLNYKRLPTNFLRGTLLGCGLALSAIALNGLTDFVLFNTRLSMFFWSVIAVISALLQNKELLTAREGMKNRRIGFSILPALSNEEIEKNKSYNLKSF
ncbi:O-antigen ligase family protein [Pectinatus haikarae]|uniref:O-antigen ligase family protein n=1 Tax=Pectinatus haikarae TaxID=349096 RepID=UPI0018C554B7|nr:O-antigen ligase family protein [Pectinatus haikarae]